MKKLVVFLLFSIATVCQAKSQNQIAYEYTYQQSCHFAEESRQELPFRCDELVGKPIYYIIDTQTERCYEVRADGTYNPDNYHGLDYNGNGVYSFSNASMADIFLGIAATEPSAVLGDFIYFSENFTKLRTFRSDSDGYDCSDHYSRTGRFISARPVK